MVKSCAGPSGPSVLPTLLKKEATGDQQRGAACQKSCINPFGFKTNVLNKQ